MEQAIAFMVLGLGSGALVGGLALAIVLQFRGSGVINLATGAIAMFAAYVFFGLRTGAFVFLPFPFPPYRISLGEPWALVPAFIGTILISIVLGLLLDLLFGRALRHASPLAKLVASVGVLLTLQSIILLRFGVSGVGAPPVLPETGSITVFGLPIPANRFMLAGIVIAAALALMALYRYTRFGLATRAAAENEENAMLAGLSPRPVALGNTVMGAVLAGCLGVLVAPISQLDPVTLTFAVVPALAAALLARFTSFAIAAAAGLILGSVTGLLTYLQQQEWFPKAEGGFLPGVAELIYFVVVLVALLWRGASLPGRGTLVEQRLPPAPRPPAIAKPAIIFAVIGVVLLMGLPEDFRQALINTLISIVVILSLVVIAGFVGQISLAQIALAGVAGYTLFHLTSKTGIPFPFAPIIAVAAATLFGVLMAVPALRVRGIHLAIVTLAAAVALERFGFQNTVWGGDALQSPIPPPEIFGAHLGTASPFRTWDGLVPSPAFGLLCLAIVIPLCMMVASLRRSRLGQQMLAVRSNERAAAAAGVSVRNVKLAGFTIAAFVAGVAGVLYAYNLGAVTPARFSLVAAFAFIAYAFIGGITVVSGAVMGGFLVSEGVGGLILNQYIGIPVAYQVFAAGIILILAVVFMPHGLALAPPEKTPHGMVIRLIKHGAGRMRGGAEQPSHAHATKDTAATADATGDGTTRTGAVAASKRRERE